jgi:hypothetical protein
MVQALAPWRPDESLDHSIRTTARYGRGDDIDTDPSGPLAEAAAVHHGAIAEQMACVGAQGVASITWRHTQAAVGFAVMFTCTSSRRP